MFRIGEFSKLCGLSADTLYHYERLKILRPIAVDALTGYRYYDASQLVTVNKILALKDAGFALDEIAHTLEGDVSRASLIQMLENKAKLLDTALAEEHSRLERLHTHIFLIKNGGIPYMNGITMKKVSPILVASTRRAFPTSAFDENLEEMWPAVNAYITKNGAKPAIPCLMIYHSGWWDMKQWNIAYDAQNLDVEVAEPITRAFDGDGDVRVYELPMVEKMACVVHNGPFSSIGETCDTLFAWMKQNGYCADGPIREIYHKGDWATDNPEEYVTELQIPIQ